MEKLEKRTSLPAWRRNRSLNFSIGLVLSLTLVITAFEWNFKSPLTDKPIDLPTTIDIDKSEMLTVRVPSPPKSIAPPNPDDIIEKKDEPEKPIDPVEKLPPITTVPGNEVDEKAIDDLFTAFAPGKETTEEAKYELIPAEPIGGEKAFYEYLYKNIHYPEHLLNRGTTGKVMVRFDVDKNGKITNIQILEGFDKTLEKEIIRVLKKSAAWKPARLGKENVRTSHKIPFSFDLN